VVEVSLEILFHSSSKMFYYKYYYTEDMDTDGLWSNLTKVYNNTNDDFASNYEAVEDITIDTVLTTIYLDSILFVAIMLMYEWLRKKFPSVYSAEKKRQYKMGGLKRESDFQDDDDGNEPHMEPQHLSNSSSLESEESEFEKSMTDNRKLPEIFSLSWVSNVLDVSWYTVRKKSGLDGYFFLRYIRMNLRICSVVCIWAFFILIPTYATGFNKGQQGWYHMSVANVRDNSWRLWIPTLFAYFFSGFIFFVMKQEYRHFLELRMEFLASGTSYINHQPQYSLMVENIPHELRSEKALYDYFESLFPGKVHSTSMVLNLSDLEAVALRCMRVCRRLEKSFAHYHATGKRATHNVGTPRMTILGIDMAPCDEFCCGSSPNVAYVDNKRMTEKPQKGTHVDSISYYTYDLSSMNKIMCNLQGRKAEIALEGTNHPEASNWFTKIVVSAHEMANEIMNDSAEDNALCTSYSAVRETGTPIPQAELMCQYGTLGVGQTPRSAQCSPYTSQQGLDRPHSPIGSDSSLLQNDDEGSSSPGSIRSKRQKEVLEKAMSRRQRKLKTPGKTESNNVFLRRIAGRLGLDFVVAGVKFANRQIGECIHCSNIIYVHR